MTTVSGGLLSVFILTLTLAYAIQKLYAIFERSDPTINENTEINFYDKGVGLNINNSNIRFAISFYGYDSEHKIESKYDPRYLSLIAV